MGRSPCCDKANVKRGPWSPEEDAILKNFVERFGNGGNWIALPQKAGLRRCGKSCRLRWLNYLRPALRHGGFTHEEDNLILSLYGEMGSKWSVIASKLPGRTDNDVKNYWNTKLKKRYFMNTRETTPSPPPTTEGPAAAAAIDSPSPTPSPPPPAIVYLEADDDNDDLARVLERPLVDADDEFLQKSNELYAELVGLIEQSKNTTTTTTSSLSEEASEASSSSLLTAELNADSSSSNVWPMNVDDTFSSKSSLFDSFSANYLFDSFSANYSGINSTHVGGAVSYSFQDFESLLASTYHEVMQQDDQLLYQEDKL